MPLYMDVHTKIKDLTQEKLAEDHRKDLEYEQAEGVHFKEAWADPETGTCFCLSEAPDQDAVRRVHRRAGHPANEVYPVTLHV
ncbi:nickel-binding protein [Allostreptomyces psammosilenae]|uniref:Gualylate cyclase n=1 Tax=Allostreptomyces psammosilenae TaxID=1892865 RepID=A0A852ZZ40_9ACTN|nr:nickel-binding protein [Allostreptomyces psammosilenae]NYI06490.1 hypothetical protein [Allostreptomyces psammosilenae]